MRFASPSWLLPSEDDMLAGVVANLAADLPKLVYADWLEERADPRGEFLRKFVEADRKSNSLKSLPDSSKYPQTWRELVAVSLVERLRKSGLAQYRDTLVGLAKPAIEIICDGYDDDIDADPVGGSRLGGLPSLSRGSEWPRCDQGPLMFLAQFDLTEFGPALCGRMLPRYGLLSFFQYRDIGDDIQGEEGDELRVILTRQTSDLIALEPPDDMTEDNGRPTASAALSFRETLDLPTYTEPWEAHVPIPRELQNNYWELLWEQRASKHALFGFARPRHIVRDPIPGPEWQQLITFESDDELGWGWGDGHEFFWYIRTADLLAGNFDNTRGYDG